MRYYVFYAAIMSSKEGGISEKISERMHCFGKLLGDQVAIQEYDAFKKEEEFASQYLGVKYSFGTLIKVERGKVTVIKTD